MPAFANSYLGVMLENPGPNNTYSPGDTIIGNVFRTQHAVSHSAVVKVWLCGEARAVVRAPQGDRDRLLQSHFSLITESRENLYDGPLHIPVGGQRMSWPFAITIPTRVSRQVRNTASPTFLPLDLEAVAQQTLPSSVAEHHHDLVAHIEYWVEAHLWIDGNGETRGSFKAQTPFILRNYYNGPRLVSFGQKIHRRKQSIGSQRLIPGMEQAELSWRDKVKKFYQTGSVPKFHFQIEIGFPDVIQLEPPGMTGTLKPIKVAMRVTPLWTSTSQILQGVRQTAKLTTFRLTLKSITTTHASFGKTYTATSEEEVVNIMTPLTLSALRTSNIALSCTDDASFINVGELINLRLGYLGPPVNHDSLRREVTPSMETYNIRHKHKLMWEVGLTIGNETVMDNGSSPVRILDSVDPREFLERPAASAASEGEGDDTWIKPPEEEELPTFEQARAEGAPLRRTAGVMR
ncbi:hypothetical protein HJFPF1_04344 [Paramyrothecium foliicola]|nr:hypothetical protein HJFPF1_04344 [Paramyrothecium foliicola]